MSHEAGFNFMCYVVLRHAAGKNDSMRLHLHNLHLF